MMRQTCNRHRKKLGLATAQLQPASTKAVTAATRAEPGATTGNGVCGSVADYDGATIAVGGSGDRHGSAPVVKLGDHGHGGTPRAELDNHGQGDPALKQLSLAQSRHDMAEHYRQLLSRLL
ncbi:hypothetical protein ZWY2020_058947 [Hordeum vulgare]|nr:hypothetical protein ZWY2020_058947 [Hordeum vulgare]